MNKLFTQVICNNRDKARPDSDNSKAALIENYAAKLISWKTQNTI